MKEVVKVSISGISFVFDHDAYEVMKEYLDKLEKGYAKNPDGREIIADIEARIAELLLSMQENEKPVGRGAAESVVAQLGFPDDMDAAPEIPVESIPKRLYRNSDGAVIGGVCSGLGTYFRVDPVWIRIGFFAPLLLCILGAAPHMGWFGDFMGSLFGVFILLYLILWIAIPMARTPRQKLEMRGEKITAASIKQNFREDAQAISPSPGRERSASVWADIMYGLGRVLQVLLKIIVVFFAVILGIVGISLLVALFAVIFGTGAVLSWGTLTLPALVGTTPVAYTIMLLLLVLLPVVVLVYLLFRAIFGSRTNRSFLTVTGVIWLLILIYTTAVTARNAGALRENIEEARFFGPWDRIEHDIEDWDEQEWREEWRNFSHDGGDMDSDDTDTGDAIVPETAAPDETCRETAAPGQWREEVRKK